MAELGEEGVEQDAAVRIVLDAEYGERTRRGVARGRALRGRRWRRLRDLVHGDAHPEPAAAPGLARHRRIPAHGLGDALDEGEAQASAAVVARDLLARLGEGP